MSRWGSTRLLVSCSALGLAGMLVSGWGFGWGRFWANWLIWTLFLLTIGLGCLFIVGLEHVVGAKWSVPIRRIPERLSGLVPLMNPALLLALISLPSLFPWTHARAMEDPVVAGKSGWLNVPFFVVRLLICIALWLVSYRVLVSGSFRQDWQRDLGFNVRARRLSPLFMVIFGITITVVAFDWISGLEPTWYSDIFGVYLFAGTFLASLAATSLLLIHQLARRKLPGVRSDHVYNLGGFMFAFTVFWGYIGFAQFLLMWYANLPEEVFWYKERLHGLWIPIISVIALFHFFIPFIALIPRDAKSNLKRLGWVSVLMLTAHWLDLYWMIMPSVGKSPKFGWMELSFALFFVCVALLWIRRALSHGADMPIGDPFLREGLEFRL
jgi:hypothetical protein